MTMISTQPAPISISSHIFNIRSSNISRPITLLMAQPSAISNRITKQEEEESYKRIHEQFRDHISTLPTVEGCSFNPLCRYNGFYVPVTAMAGTMASQQLFQARPTDILLATAPKSGTTWLKALLFATVNRNAIHYTDPQHPLLKLSPHECVPFLEFRVYANNQIPDLESLVNPRLFATHIPFHMLPTSIIDSGSRIVHICRNPKDNFVSLWHFINKFRAKIGQEPIQLEAGFDHFCNGVSLMGPLWDNVLGYWKASLERPDKIFFMKFEESKKDPIATLKRVAMFIGHPFTIDEENDGTVEGITRLCEFENLSRLKVNRSGTTKTAIGELDNSMYFRNGVVDDWVNHLTPEMAQQIDDITRSKFHGTGLSF